MTNKDHDDIVIGAFCAPYVKNSGGWLFPGRQIIKSFSKACELAKVADRMIKNGKSKHIKEA